MKANPKNLDLSNFHADCQTQTIKDSNSGIVDKMVECCKCNVETKNVDMVLMCDLCQKSLHAECANIGKEDYILIRRLNSKIRWFCVDCDLDFHKIKKDNETLTGVIASLREDLAASGEDPDLENTVMNDDQGSKTDENTDDDGLKTEIMNEVIKRVNFTCKTMCEKFDQDILKLNEGHEMLLYHLKKLVIMNKNVTENKKSEMPDNTMENIEKNNPLPEGNLKNGCRIEKDSDKNIGNTGNELDRKRNNLILYNITESKNEDISKRIEYDLDVCEDIIRNELQIELFSIEKILRLGKRDDNKVSKK